MPPSSKTPPAEKPRKRLRLLSALGASEKGAAALGYALAIAAAVMFTISTVGGTHNARPYPVMHGDRGAPPAE